MQTAEHTNRHHNSPDFPPALVLLIQENLLTQDIQLIIKKLHLLLTNYPRMQTGRRIDREVTNALPDTIVTLIELFEASKKLENVRPCSFECGIKGTISTHVCYQYAEILARNINTVCPQTCRAVVISSGSGYILRIDLLQ